MELNSILISISMLKEVIAGKTYNALIIGGSGRTRALDQGIMS